MGGSFEFFFKCSVAMPTSITGTLIYTELKFIRVRPC